MESEDCVVACRPHKAVAPLTEKADQVDAMLPTTLPGISDVEADLGSSGFELRDDRRLELLDGTDGFAGKTELFDARESCPSHALSVAATPSGFGAN